MNIRSIKYGRKKIKIKYEILKNLYGFYEPNKNLLVFDKRVKGIKLFNTIMHELFHIIIYQSGIQLRLTTDVSNVLLPFLNNFNDDFTQYSDGK